MKKIIPIDMFLPFDLILFFILINEDSINELIFDITFISIFTPIFLETFCVISTDALWIDFVNFIYPLPTYPQYGYTFPAERTFKFIIHIEDTRRIKCDGVDFTLLRNFDLLWEGNKSIVIDSLEPIYSEFIRNLIKIANGDFNTFSSYCKDERVINVIMEAYKKSTGGDLLVYHFDELSRGIKI